MANCQLPMYLSTSARPENHASRAGLPMPSRLGFAVSLAMTRVGSTPVLAPVVNHCLGGWERLRRVFRADAAAWPRRAVA
jgi:hypothetical protein